MIGAPRGTLDATLGQRRHGAGIGVRYACDQNSSSRRRRTTLTHHAKHGLKAQFTRQGPLLTTEVGRGRPLGTRELARAIRGGRSSYQRRSDTRHRLCVQVREVRLDARSPGRPIRRCDRHGHQREDSGRDERCGLSGRRRQRRTFRPGTTVRYHFWRGGHRAPRGHRRFLEKTRDNTLRLVAALFSPRQMRSTSATPFTDGVVMPWCIQSTRTGTTRKH